jgi:hypothetical protein
MIVKLSSGFGVRGFGFRVQVTEHKRTRSHKSHAIDHTTRMNLVKVLVINMQRCLGFDDLQGHQAAVSTRHTASCCHERGDCE